MHLDDATSELLKAWIISKLEGNSDADSDVLADYALALLKTDGPDDTLKENVAENLKDFLPDRYESFTNDLFDALHTKAYDPSAPPTTKPSAKRPHFDPPRRQQQLQQQPRNQPKKRGFNDVDGDGNQNGRIQTYEGGERPVKQPRRGGRGGMDQRGGRFPPHPPISQLSKDQSTPQYGQPQHEFPSQPPKMQHQLSPIPKMPTPPPGMEMFDPSNPMAMMQAMQQMQQMMGMMARNLPNAASPSIANGFHRPQARCRDYETKGFCTRGASCPYEHGDDRFVIPPGNEEYDPNAAILNINPVRTGSVDTTTFGRGRGGQTRGRGRGAGQFRGGGRRAEFSINGPNTDQSIVSIVVEQIPEEKFDEGTVRSFFSQFGNIEAVDMQPYKRLAIVTYDSYDAARAAYDSPLVVFDNRFVKVYWYKPDTVDQPRQNGHARSSASNGHEGDIKTKDTEPDINPEEFARKQEEAQRKHDEVKKHREEAEKQKADLDTKLKLMDEERKKMAALLAKKTGKAPTPADPPNNPGDNEQTRILKQQLAKLEAEAKSLGIDPNDAPENNYSPYALFRGRGAFRSRTRGRGGFPSYRGGWAGGNPGFGGAVKKLDNRPKTVSVVFNEGQYEDHEEQLGQHLLFGHESATLLKHPDRSDAALISFQQRFEAENFVAGARESEILGGGKADLGWHVDTKKSEGGVIKTEGASGDVDMDAAAVQPAQLEAAREARDLDTYADDDDERWDIS